MSRVTLFFAGDFCSRPTPTYISVSDELKSEIAACDLKVVNFEVSLMPEGINPPQKHPERLIQHEEVPEFLRGLGFNLFPLANNHVFDWGEKGFEKTKGALGEECFGSGSYEEAYRVKTVEVNGLKIGFLALTYAAYRGVFDDVAKHDGLGCAYINDLKVNHVILESKKNMDYLFVLAHDGIEYIDVPTPETIARYRDFIDYGADGVIGTHPHCPQGWEEYKGRPIFYSLGNFFFNSKEDTLYRAWNRPHWYEGMCVKMTVSGDSMSYEIINTRNIDNVQLCIDNSTERDLHNEELNSFLRDQKKYDNYYDEKCRRLGLTKIIDLSIHPQNLKAITKILLIRWKQKKKHKPFPSDFQLVTLLRNDSRRTVLRRTLK